MIDYTTIATGEKAMQEYGHKTVRQRQNINRAKVLGVNLLALRSHHRRGRSVWHQE